MAQVIRTLCDPCLQDDHESAGTTVAIVLDGKAADLDLCTEHRKTFIDPLEVLLTDARPAEGTTAPRDRLTCPEPGCSHSAASTSALETHTRVHHRRGLATYDMDPRSIYVCPHRKCNYRASNAQGLGAHMRAEHSDSIKNHPPESLRGVRG